MKAKKRVLSTILSLSSILLVGCNKNISSSSSCSITTSTPTIESTPEPTPEPTPSKTVEELNKELFDNYAILGTNKVTIIGFRDTIPEEYLNLETIIIPEKIEGNEYTIKEIQNIKGGLFSKFSKVKTIKIPSTITSILTLNSGSSSYESSPFVNLPNLENIEVDSENKWYFSKSNCLIELESEWVEGVQTSKGTYKVICGWKNVEIPDEITTIRSYGFSYNTSITSIKLNSGLTLVGEQGLTYLPNLTNIDLNGNTNFALIENDSYKVFYDLKSNRIWWATGDVIVPENVTRFEMKGFSNVTSVKLHDKVTILYINCINGTKIKSLSIPASANAIYASSFAGVNEINLTISPDNNHFNLKDNVLYFNISEGTSSGNLTYAYNDAIIPDEIITLGSYNFRYCQALSSLTLHNNFQTVSTTAFNLISSEKFNAIKFKGTVAQFKTKKFTSTGSNIPYSLYDCLKQYPSLTVNFLEDDGSGNWSTIKETHIMSEIESL